MFFFFKFEPQPQQILKFGYRLQAVGLLISKSVKNTWIEFQMRTGACETGSSSWKRCVFLQLETEPDILKRVSEFYILVKANQWDFNH